MIKHRHAKAIFFAFLFFYFLAAVNIVWSETIPATNGLEYYSDSYGQVSDSSAGLCALYSVGYGQPVCLSTETECKVLDQWQHCNVQINVFSRASTVYTCPANSGYTLSGTSCIRPDCLAGQIRGAGGVCSRDCNALKNTSYSGYIPVTGNPAGVCQDGCSASVINATNQASANGTQVIAGTFSYGGASCFGNNITGGAPTSQCPAGKCSGLINGVSPAG